MPTYEYTCSKCGRNFEKFQSITAKPLTVCPKDACARQRWGKGRVQRVIGAGAGLIFKGSGFYITDYRSEDYKQAAKKDAPAPAPPAGGEGKAKAGSDTATAQSSGPTPAKSKADKS